MGLVDKRVDLKNKFVKPKKAIAFLEKNHADEKTVKNAKNVDLTKLYLKLQIRRLLPNMDPEWVTEGSAKCIRLEFEFQCDQRRGSSHLCTFRDLQAKAKFLGQTNPGQALHL